MLLHRSVYIEVDWIHCRILEVRGQCPESERAIYVFTTYTDLNLSSLDKSKVFE